MAKKYAFRSVIYLVIYALLALVEKRVGIHGLSLAFCVATVFCKENLLLALVPYAVSTALVHFDLWYVVVVMTGCFCVLLYTIIVLKTKRKYRIWANALIITVSQTPVFFLYFTTTEQMIFSAISIPIAVAFHYVFLVALYPVLVRGVRYGTSDREKIFASISLIPIFAGLAVFQIKGVSIFYFAVVLFTVVLSTISGTGGVIFSIFAGIGGSAITLEPIFLCTASLIGGAVYCFRNVHRFVLGIGAVGAFLLSLFIFKEELSLITILPTAVGGLIVLLPKRIFYRAKGCNQSVSGRFALRTVANRDREEVGAKLSSVAVAFRRMQGLLESDERTLPTASDFTDLLADKCCSDCPKLASCREKIGGANRYFNKLATVGMEKGRVNILDVDGKLGGVCTRLPRVINVANVYLEKYASDKERRNGIMQGRDMVADNLGGTADLLAELAKTVSVGFGFDVDGEKRVTEELACANIVAGDVAIYEKGEKIILTVRECDEKKPELKSILSSAVGKGMYPSERSVGINGTVNLVFRPSPNFGVLYGEKSVGKESECGDAKQAVQVGINKLMFVLSDGMGTGEEAKKTGVNTIALIETFYKAGFSHSTIFSCVSRLLALRSKETFSALDVAIMDTQTGEIVFIKQGGRESYLFTKSGVEIIEGGSLPLGIIDFSEPIIVRRKLRNGDLCILLSDGVADNLSKSDVVEIVGALNTLNPQIIADKVVDNALKKAGDKLDDMTVMTIRVVENVLPSKVKAS